MERVVPLSDSLGLPDVFPHLAGCPEDELTPQALQHGYQHSEAAALGFDSKRELALTLTDQLPSFYSPASLSYWRKALREQLQGPARHLAAKRKAHVLYDAPLSSAAAAASQAADAGPGAAEQAPNAPHFPQQPSRGVTSREAAEAWAKEFLASPGAPSLHSLGWGGPGEAGAVPHGFPRTPRLLEMLAELAAPMPRALWFLRVVALNRVRPAGWDGASEAQARSKQLTDDLLSFLEAAAIKAAAAAPAAGRPPRPAQQRAVQPGGSGEAAGGSQADAAAAAPAQQWTYGVRLAGHCCAAGLVDAARVAEWAATPKLLLLLPPAARPQLLSLLERCLPAAQLAQQQAVALLELCLKGAEAAAAAGAAAGAKQPGGGHAGAADAELVQRGLLRAAGMLLELHPSAFVSADEHLLQPLADEAEKAGARSVAQQACLAGVAGARHRLSQALHARVLHWHDGKAMELLDAQLRSGSTAAAAAAELCKLLSQHPGPAAGSPAIHDAVRLVCEWAVAAPVADFGAALCAAVAGGQATEHEPGGAEALLPERVLFGMGMLQALQAEQQQQQGPAAGEPPSGQSSAAAAAAANGASQQPQQPPALQAAAFGWLHAVSRQQQRRPQPWRQERVLLLALLMAEAGILCPAAYLRSCLALGAFEQGAAGGPAVGADPAASSSSSSSSGAPAFHLLLLEQLHPTLDFPSLDSNSSANGGKAAAGNGSAAAAGGHAWSAARQSYACGRAAVLAQHQRQAAAAGEGPAAAGAAAAEEVQAMEWEHLVQVSDDSSSEEEADGGSLDAAGLAQQQRQRWADPSLLQQERAVLEALGLAAARGAADSPAPAAAEPDAFASLLASVRRLQPGQHRHIAAALLAAAKAFLATTDSGAGGRQSSPGAAAASSGAAGSPRDGWLLQALALLRACCAHREVLSLVSTCLNLLQRAVAAAVRAGTTGQQQQAGKQLGELLNEAQQRWQERSRVAPPLLFALLSAHAGSLAASDIASKLLPMLTGGLWRLQQPQHQQAAKQSLAGQLELAALLLALPGGSSQQWLTKMEQQHSSSHWVALLLQQRATAVRALHNIGTGAGGQQQVMQHSTAGLQAFLQQAQQLPAARRAGLSATPAGQASASDQQALIAFALQATASSAATTGSAMDEAEALAALACLQHGLPPAALPAVLQQLRSRQQGGGVAEQLLALGPAASQALLCDPKQAHTALQHQPSLAGAAGTAAPGWQLALAFFASSGGGTSAAPDSSSVLRLGSNEIMSAAVAAASPATAGCCWLLLRLLLDEQQRQGGHRLAEAERQLAGRVVQEAVRRPEAAAALAATLCSLSGTAAAGQQLLLEVEAVLRNPVVDLARLAASGPSTPGSVASKALPPASPSASAAPQGPEPFAGELGLVEAALVCLSTGSSAERQHAFAQQLIKQLAALADMALADVAADHAQHGQHAHRAPQPHAPVLAAAGAAGAGGPPAVQVSAWLRLALLLPLLPLVYKHRSHDPAIGLRGQLLRALLRLLASPAVRADAAVAAAAGQGAAGECAAATAAAAAAAAGEPLPQRLLHLLRALLVGGWASWMRLEGSKLRDVPAFEHSHQLAAEAAALPLPPRLQAAVSGALPLGQQQGVAQVPACRVQGPSGNAPAAAAVGASPRAAPASGGGASFADISSSLMALDPWLLLEGGTGAGGAAAAAQGAAAVDPPLPGSLPQGSITVGTAAAAPPLWLEGAVKRRKSDLRYMPAPLLPPGQVPSVGEQLRRRRSSSR